MRVHQTIIKESVKYFKVRRKMFFSRLIGLLHAYPRFHIAYEFREGSHKRENCVVIYSFPF